MTGEITALQPMRDLDPGRMRVAGIAFLVLAIGGYVAATRFELTDLQVVTLRTTVVLSTVGLLASIVALVPMLDVEAVAAKVAIAVGLVAVGALSFTTFPAPAVVNNHSSRLFLNENVLAGPGEVLARSVDFDCFNTAAPNIGNAAVQQCLAGERQTMLAAKNGRLVIVVDSRKLITDIHDRPSGQSLAPDSVTKGPAAWPDVGKPVFPQRSLPLRPCGPVPDPGERCMP